jgi:hypothetical protein
MFQEATHSTALPTVLVVNDKFPSRRGRLRKVLREFLPLDMVCEASELKGASMPGSELVAVSGNDGASAWPKHSFDRVLLDAPCSNERHAVQSGGKSKGNSSKSSSKSKKKGTKKGKVSQKRKGKSKEKSDIWSVSRVKREAVQQFALLRSAMRALRPGGRLVYSTCSIDPIENDRVVEKLLARENGRLIAPDSPKMRRKGKSAGVPTGVPTTPPAIHVRDPLSELTRARASSSDAQHVGVLLKGVRRTLYGAVMLPDTSHYGFGPLYWAVLEKDGAALEGGSME